MSKEPLWTDAKIKALTVLAANTVDPQARWMHEQIAMDMRNDYERALAFRNEDIGRLQGELGHTKAQCLLIADSLKLVMLERDITQARIAELEAQLRAAQKWQPMTHGRHGDGIAHIQVVYDGKMINAGFADEDGSCEVSIRLPDDIRLCQIVKPAA